MKPKSFWLSVILFMQTTYTLSAVENLRLPGMRSLAVGKNGVVTTNLFNPSLISLSNQKDIQIQYYNRYGLSELKTIGGSVLYPNNFLPVSFYVSSFGYDEYRESMFRFSAGKRIAERWAAGISVQYAMIQTLLLDERYSCLSTDLGITYLLSDKALLGVSLLNLPSVSFGDEVSINDFMNYSFQLGLKWDIMDEMSIIGSLGTEKEKSIRGSLGIEYELLKSFYVRAGINTSPLIPSFGIGYSFSVITVDIAAVSHTVLGISTGISITCSF
ncbi:hypothetical protein LJC57_04050 [Parabacteroides sp. OttesenSCG-928-G07]|nr:hypothetical protein [Parabacteroides sp. OttesenSCG-928-G07]